MSVRMTASMIETLAHDATEHDVRLRALSLRASADRSLTAASPPLVVWTDGLIRRFGLKPAAALVSLAEASLRDAEHRRHERRVRLAAQRERLVARGRQLTARSTGFLGSDPFHPTDDLSLLAAVARHTAAEARRL